MSDDFVTQTINLTSEGAEYTLPVTITEVLLKDISGDTVVMCLAGYDPPTPDKYGPPAVTFRPGVNSVVVQALVTDPAMIGSDFWPWVKITDDPEAPARRAPLLVQVR
jgi:hypothetical protein